MRRVLLLWLTACRSQLPGTGDGATTDGGGTVDGGGTADGGSVGDDTGPSADSICASGVAAGELAVSWSLLGSNLRLHDGDGTVHAVHAFSDGQTLTFVGGSADSVGIVALDRSGSVMAADVSLLTRAGEPIAGVHVDGAYQTSAWLGDGTLAYSPGHEDFDAWLPWMHGWLLDEGGAVALDGFVPLGPMDGGLVAACTTDEARCGWLDPASGVFAQEFPLEAVEAGAQRVWIEDGELVLASASASVRVDIGSADTVIDAVDGWVLVGSELSATARVAVADRSVTELADLPDGWRAFNALEPRHTCQNNDWRLTTDGRVLAVLRTDELARIWRHDPATSTWETVGRPMTDAVFIGVWERDGAVQIASTDPLETFCQPYEFAPTTEPDVLSGTTLQLVRPDDGFALSDLLSPVGLLALSTVAPLDIRSGGMCAIVPWEGQVIDLSSGEVVALGGETAGWVEDALGAPR